MQVVADCMVGECQKIVVHTEGTELVQELNHTLGVLVVVVDHMIELDSDHKLVEVLVHTVVVVVVVVRTFCVSLEEEKPFQPNIQNGSTLIIYIQISSEIIHSMQTVHG